MEITPTLSQRIARWVLDLETGHIPERVRECYMLHIIDTIGCGFAAVRLGAFANVAQLAEAKDSGTRARILGRPLSYPTEQAAFANGVLFHALDFDDTHPLSVIHPTAVILATAMALGDELEAEADDVIVATLAGVEVACRIGMAARNAFHLRGFHPTSVVGTLGATITAAKLLGLTAQQMANALGIAASYACGIFAYLDGASNPKPLHAGQAAKNGIEAARLAKVGVTGPATVFESRFGFFGAFAGNSDIPLGDCLDSIGHVWESERLAIKPYPACHAMHASIDCAIDLQSRHGFSVEDIESITVFLACDRDRNLLMEPRAAKVAPTSDTVGKFSLPYSIASALTDGALTLGSYDPAHLTRPHVRALAQKVDYVLHDFDPASHSLPGGVTIGLTSGLKLSAVRQNERGGPEEPLSRSEVLKKFAANAADLDVRADLAVSKLVNLCFAS